MSATTAITVATDTASVIAFEPGKKVGAVGTTYITHSVIHDTDLKEGDIFITELPTYLEMPYGEVPDTITLTDSTTVTGCDKSYFEYCLIFRDIRWIVWKVKQGITISAPTRITARINILSIPPSIFQSDTTFESHVWKGKDYVRKLTRTITIANWALLLGDFPVTECGMRAIGN